VDEAGVSQPAVSIETIYWHPGDSITLRHEIHIPLDNRHTDRALVEGSSRQLVTQRLRELRHALHEGRPR
jgi:hypothetical protein